MGGPRLREYGTAWGTTLNILVLGTRETLKTSSLDESESEDEEDEEAFEEPEGIGDCRGWTFANYGCGHEADTDEESCL